MKLHRLRISNFQSFGPEATEITLESLTFLIGPNGSGKTATLQALCRLFAFDPALRRIQHADFHVPSDETEEPEERKLWIESEFIFPETEDSEDEHSTIPPNFAHMRLDTPDGFPSVRFRLDATLDSSGEIAEEFNYVLNEDGDGEPLDKQTVPRADRGNIQVHYLPARRDPSSHIAYTANSMLGRLLRSVDWQAEKESIKGHATNISDLLASNSGVSTLGEFLSGQWKSLHKGAFFSDPKVTFVGSELESLLRHMSVTFSPGHGEALVDFSRLSDGQKSMLYLTLVLTAQGIGRAVLRDEDAPFDVERLKPAVFTLVAMEEPENSLSPHYLGRIVQSLRTLGEQDDAQSIIATHAPAMLRRVPSEDIRYMRLDGRRQTQVSTILMPAGNAEASKFVREAVQAFPELYFARLVVLCEGDSEEIVIPRLLKAKEMETDGAGISVVPLGGRHVNHFWRLLTALNIPFITLLDLDLARYQGGWGRVHYVLKKLLAFSPENCGFSQADVDSLPKWNGTDRLLERESGLRWLDFLEGRDVFFSSPLDLDFAMLKAFPSYYTNDPMLAPDEAQILSVLGEHRHNPDQYSEDEQSLFSAYHKLFKLGSKPSVHLRALAQLEDAELIEHMPASLGRLIDAIRAKLEELPE